MFRKIFLMTLLMISLIVCKTTFAVVFISEFMADPPSTLLGDANRDGVRHSLDDEFIEIFNTGPYDIPLTIWSLWDGSRIRHIFDAGTILEAEEFLVIFGGGNLSSLAANAVTTSSGTLSLNNSGDSIFLKNQNGVIIDLVTYGIEADQDQSLVRFEEDLSLLRLHSEVSEERLLFSPGSPARTRTVQNPLSPNSPVTAPEPETILMLIIAFALWRSFYRGSQNRGA